MREFLERVLPDGGDYSVLVLNQGTPREVNEIPTLDDLAATLSKLSTQPVDLYYGTAAFAGRRSAANAQAKRALYLDLDSKDFGSKDHARAELSRFCLAVGLPAPAILVDSGGGVHCYWPLDRDLPTAAWTALATALKQRCKDAAFAADPSVTADAARVLRVPGTLNHKEATPRPCVLISDTGEVFDPTVLFKALTATVQLAELPPATKPGNVSINDDLDGGLYEKPDAETLRAMLGKVGGGGDRERWLTVLQALHDWSAGGEEGLRLADEWSTGQPKYKGTDDVQKTWESLGNYPGARVTVAAIIKWAKEGGYKAAAAVEAAVDEDDLEIEIRPGLVASISPRSAELAGRGNRKRLTKEEAIGELAGEFIYVENQGTYYSIGRRNILDKEVIRDEYTWKMPQSGNGAIDPCTLLKNSFHTRQVHSMGFHPGEGAIYTERGKSFVNRYTAPPDEITPTKNEVLLIQDFLNYLFPRVEDQTFKKFYMQWLGHLVQRPGVKLATALLFISETYGIGKSTAAFEIPRLLAGIDNTRAITNEILSRPFTGYLGECHLLHLSEVHVNGLWNSSDIANRLKSVVTDSTVNVHRKGFDDYDIPNRIAVTATSNYNDAMYISSKQERRWGVYELSPARGYTPDQHRRYFDVVHKFLAGPRAAGVLRYIFRRISLAGFNPQEPPPTTLAKERMEVLSLPEDAQVVYEAFKQGNAPFHRDLFLLEDIRGLVEHEIKKFISTKRAGQIVSKVIPNVVTFRTRVDKLGAAARVWCCRDPKKWDGVEPELIRAELSRRA